VPYVIALVDLAEGPRLMTIWFGCDPAKVSVGMQVEVVFDADGESFRIPLFRPVGGG
jgi:uncharacterized OB-fold protein